MASQAAILSADEIYQWASSHSSESVRAAASVLQRTHCTSASLQRADIVDDLVAEGLPRICAKDVVASFKTDHHAPVVVFWDIENQAIPSNCSGNDIIRRIKKGLRSLGLIHSAINAYGAHKLISERKRADLVMSGCHLIDTPHDGSKETADKMLLADVLLWAMDHPAPAKIILICGDKDLSYLMARLGTRGYTIVLVHQASATHRLKQAASALIAWEMLIDDGSHERSMTVDAGSSNSAAAAAASGLSLTVSPPDESDLMSLGSLSLSPQASIGQLHLQRDDNDDTVSIAGSEEDRSRANQDGMLALVDELNARGKSGTGFVATATLSDMLNRRYPMLKQAWGGNLMRLYKAAKQAGLIEIEQRAGKHNFIKLMPPRVT